MRNINWDHPATWEDVCRRHAARARWNAVRRLVAEGRRSEVLTLLARYGWVRGVQARIAAELKVHRSTVTRDLQKLFPLVTVCPTCGAIQPRPWWTEPPVEED